MSAVVEEAMTLYEVALRGKSYLDGWSRFELDDPEGFAEYMGESRELDAGLSDVVPV